MSESFLHFGSLGSTREQHGVPHPAVVRRTGVAACRGAFLGDWVRSESVFAEGMTPGEAELSGGALGVEQEGMDPGHNCGGNCRPAGEHSGYT